MAVNKVPVESTADAYLELLVARGVEYFFGNGGTDFGPISEAYAKRMASEQPVPKPVTIPHEITGTAMAMGYAMITGKPQVVMVHTIAGTANAVGSLISANEPASRESNTGSHPLGMRTGGDQALSAIWVSAARFDGR